ncbi:single-stranded DNA-binding protein [bacterium]|jgi:hypothetical protein|nr:single-stranded DNA-binding protein [bacterium]MDB4347951.1 single-stranded DNA-binding protein [bacterium]MDB4347965.1 single-stranded DNA-binding protein [bacterium]MDB4350064.1 single-stranded DNA-binding protein [bacterium]
MSFEALKRQRGADISKLVQAAEAVGGAGGEKKNYDDERIWKPTVDKAGNGYAVLRFLPAAEGSDLPWVRYWDHGFKGPTGLWYIENSLTSIGQPDPVGELNSRLWNSGHEEDKETARRQKRRLHYVVNALVVEDPSAPQNEGRVVLYKFGKKIFDKIMDVMQPSFADEKAINPFDFWEGANFKLKIRQVEGYRNYDKSEFAGTSSLYDGDEPKLEGVYNQLHSLNEFTDPKNYKTYDELKAKLARVLGEEVSMGAPTIKQEMQMNTPAPQPEYRVAEPMTADAVNMDDEDTMSYFAKLANED